MPAHIIDFYRRVLLPLHNQSLNPIGFSYEALTQEFLRVYGRMISKDTLKLNYVRHLVRVGMVDTEPDPNDKRRSLVTVVPQSITSVGKTVSEAFKKDFNKERFLNWEKQLAAEFGQSSFTYEGKPLTSDDDRFRLVRPET